MKRVAVIVTVVAVMFVVGVAFAQVQVGENNNANANDNRATATNTNANTATGGTATSGSNTNTIGTASGFGSRSLSPSAEADSTNLNTNANTNTNVDTNLQGQMQGQLQGQGQGQVANGHVDTDVNISGDEDSDRAPDAIGFPSVIAAEGTSSGSASYGFGSLGKANTETYKKVIPQIQTVLAIPDDIMSREEKVVIVKQLVKKMTDSNRTQRFLGFMWEDNSKSLLNMFGLLCWDSVWAEGQKPMQSKVDAGLVAKKDAPIVTVEVVKTEDVAITGNAGNLPVGNQK